MPKKTFKEKLASATRHPDATSHTHAASAKQHGQTSGHVFALSDLSLTLRLTLAILSVLILLWVLQLKNIIG